MRPGGSERAHRRPVTPRCESAGVAVRQRPRARDDEAGGVLGHAVAALDLLGMDLAGPLGRVGRRLHLREGPGEVRRGRASRDEDVRRRAEILTARRRERVAVGPCDSDRRSAADRERTDRLRDVCGRPALELDLLPGQPPLVEEDDAVLLEAEDLLGPEVRQL